MTDDERHERIAELFQLVDDVPADAHDERIALCREALALMAPDGADSQAAGWLLSVVGKSYYRRPAGADRVADLDAAIAAFTAAVATWTPQSQPVNWPSVQGNLGVCYSDRRLLTGGAADDRAALDAYGAALAVLDLQQSPDLWAQIASDLGAHQLQRSDGDRSEIIEDAVRWLERAGQVQSTLDLTAACAATMSNLAIAYRERAVGEREENLEQSLACLDAALEALDSGGDGDTVTRARIFLHRAETLRYRVAGSWAENGERAYADINRAADLVDPELTPLVWAEVREELGNVLRNRAAGSRAENIELAIEAYRQALTGYNRSLAPRRWALISIALAHALGERMRGDRVGNLEEALDLLRGAAEVLRADPGSLTYPGALTALGAAYLGRRRGHPADNAEAAWRYLTEALDLEERRALPPRTRAAVLNYLGNAAMARQVNGRDQHVEEAIDCYQRGLELAGDEQGQLQARLLNNSAAAYGQRPQGDRAANIARSLELYERVGAIRTRERAPLAWAEMRSNIGAVLAQSDDPAQRAAAAAALGDALEVLRDGGPTASIVTAGRNLGLLGAQAGDWPQAVDGFQTALDAADARYRQSLQLEARFDELTDIADLGVELAVALAGQARDTDAAPDRQSSLRRAAAAMENGRMRLLGELMRRDVAGLDRLREQQPELHADYVAAAARLHADEAAQWTTFQPMPDFEVG